MKSTNSNKTKFPNETTYCAKSIRNGLISGYSAGICGIIVGHPLDSMKVLLQANGDTGARNASSFSSPNGSNPSKPSGSNVETAMTRAASQTSSGINSSSMTSSVVNSRSTKANVSTAAISNTSLPPKPAPISFMGNRSIRSLYAGVTGPLLTAGLIQSINFATYDSLRRIFYQHQLQHEPDHGSFRGNHDDYLHFDNLTNIAAASFISGATISVFTSPLVLVKTKQQIMVWGFRQAIKDTYYSGMSGRPRFFQGLANFYVGYGVHFFCDAFGRAVYFTSYEFFKRQLAHSKHGEEGIGGMERKISLSERMLCAATAGSVCWAVIFPADVIRSKLYAQALSNKSTPTAMDGMELALQLIEKHGISSLYRGIGITIARAGPVAAAVLPVYDTVLAWLNGKETI